MGTDSVFPCQWVDKKNANALGIGTFFKVVILIGAAGLIITIIGLVLERKKEGKNVSSDD
jgi:hypothetical protein